MAGVNDSDNVDPELFNATLLFAKLTSSRVNSSTMSSHIRVNPFVASSRASLMSLMRVWDELNEEQGQWLICWEINLVKLALVKPLVEWTLFRIFIVWVWMYSTGGHIPYKQAFSGRHERNGQKAENSPIPNSPHIPYHPRQMSAILDQTWMQSLCL